MEQLGFMRFPQFIFIFCSSAAGLKVIQFNFGRTIEKIVSMKDFNTDYIKFM